MGAVRIGLGSLEPEILSLILDLVNDTSPQTLNSVALTSNYLNSVSKLIRGRHLTCYLTDFRTLVQTLEPVLENQAILANVKSITIEGRPESLLPFSGDHPQEAFRLLELFVTKVGRLRVLNWNLESTIPLKILEALEVHQKHASLRMFNWVPFESHEPDPTAIALSKSPALTHLRAVIKGVRAGLDTRELHFRTIVAGAPNLEYAGIMNYLSSSTSSHTNISTYKAAFDLHERPNTSIKMLTLDGYDMSKQTLDDWSTILDLSSLYNIKLSRGRLDMNYFRHAATMLPNLKEVSLNFGHVHTAPGGERSQLATAAREYLTTCSPVESLSLWSWKEIISVDEILERHGATLKSLQLHEKECASSRCTRKIFSCDELEQIIQKSPKLNSLTMDLKRITQNVKLDANDDNMKYFEALSRAGGRISSLQVYFDAGLLYLAEHPSWGYRLDGTYDEGYEDDDEEDEEYEISDEESENITRTQPKSRQCVKPTHQNVMREYVKDTWQLIYGSHRSGARTLTVKVGEWESARGSQRHGTTRRTFNPENKLVRQFIAKPMERDDEAGMCTVKVMKV